MALFDVDRFAEFVDAPQFPHDDPAGPSGAVNRYSGPLSPTDGETIELLALVSALREMDFDVAPSEPAREQQRQRLVAMAAVRSTEVPDLVESGRHRAHQTGTDSELTALWADLLTRVRRAQSGRRLIAGVASLSVIVAALGILALFAQSAIPGDTLYALKRGTEQARLVLAGSEQAQGRVLLGYANTRLEELDQLLDQPIAVSATGAGIQAAAGDAVADLLISTMDTMDAQTTDGTNALTSAAVDQNSLPTLQFVGEWGIEQFATLDDLSQRMPQQARARAEDSKDLLQQVVERLELLAQAIGCDRPEEPLSDELGPLPSPGCLDSNENASTSTAGPTGDSGASAEPTSTSTDPKPSNEPGISADPTDSETPAEPPPAEEETTVVPYPDPLPSPIPSPTEPTPPIQLPPPPAPPVEEESAEGEPCVQIGDLGIQIPGTIIESECVALSG